MYTYKICCCVMLDVQSLVLIFMLDDHYVAKSLVWSTLYDRVTLATMLISTQQLLKREHFKIYFTYIMHESFMWPYMTGYTSHDAYYRDNQRAGGVYHEIVYEAEVVNRINTEAKPR